MSFPDQDYIILAGVRSPGVCRFTKSANSPRSWDVRQGYGFSGAYVVYTGAGLAKFSIAFDLWNGDQFSAPWLQFAALLEKPKRGVKLRGMGIVHPRLQMAPWRIKDVVVEDVTAFESTDEGLYTAVVDFLEYSPPKPVLVKPTEAIPGITLAAPTASDNADAEILALRSQRGAL